MVDVTQNTILKSKKDRTAQAIYDVWEILADRQKLNLAIAANQPFHHVEFKKNRDWLAFLYSDEFKPNKHLPSDDDKFTNRITSFLEKALSEADYEHYKAVSGTTTPDLYIDIIREAVILHSVCAFVENNYLDLDKKLFNDLSKINDMSEENIVKLNELKNSSQVITRGNALHDKFWLLKPLMQRCHTNELHESVNTPSAPALSNKLIEEMITLTSQILAEVKARKKSSEIGSVFSMWHKPEIDKGNHKVNLMMTLISKNSITDAKSILDETLKAHPEVNNGRTQKLMTQVMDEIKAANTNIITPSQT